VWFYFYYSDPDRVAEYCDERACLSVCDHIFGATSPTFTKIFVHVTYCHGSVLLWHCIDMLCTSGFMDAVLSVHKPRLLDVTAQLKDSSHAALGLAMNAI